LTAPPPRGTVFLLMANDWEANRFRSELSQMIQVYWGFSEDYAWQAADDFFTQIDDAAKMAESERLHER
jgi:hypothetical protein